MFKWLHRAISFLFNNPACMLSVGTDRLILHSNHPPISLLLPENNCRYPRIAAGFVPLFFVESDYFSHPK